MKKLKILVDLDDTIEDLLSAWLITLNERHGLDVRPDDITSWDVAKFFPSLTAEEVYRPLHEPYFWQTVRRKPGAKGALEKLKADGHEVYIVTSSVYDTVPHKMEYFLFRYFPFIEWEDVIVTSHKQMVKGDVLVDDGVHNLVGGDYFKILVDMPHNRSYDAEGNGMSRAKNWEEIYSLITQYAETLDKIN